MADDPPASPVRINVLLVEDSPMQRLNAAEGLRAMGFHGVEVPGIDGAIKALNQDGFDVMISDVDLVGETMTGFLLAKAVAARWPEVAILVVSGMTEPASDQLPAGAEFLAKPYTERQLTNAVRSLMDSRADDAGEMLDDLP